MTKVVVGIEELKELLGEEEFNRLRGAWRGGVVQRERDGVRDFLFEKKRSCRAVWRARGGGAG